MPTPCQPRMGDATLLAWGPQPPLPPSVTPLAATTTIGGCVHSPHGKPCCKAAFPSRQGLSGEGEPGFATSTVRLSRGQSPAGGEGSGPRTPRRQPRGSRLRRAVPSPNGDEAARIFRRASVRAPAIPHQPQEGPDAAQVRSNAAGRACAIAMESPWRSGPCRADTSGHELLRGKRGATAAWGPAASQGTHVRCVRISVGDTWATWRSGGDMCRMPTRERASLAPTEIWGTRFPGRSVVDRGVGFHGAALADATAFLARDPAIR